MAHRAYVTEVDINTQEIRIELYPKAKLDVTKIPALIAEYKTALRFAQGGEWARRFAACVAVALDRPAVRIDVPGFVVG